MGENENIGYLTDSDGNKSSKRLWGSILLSTAIILSIFIIVYDTFASVELTSAIPILGYLYGSGTALLGIGVFENKLTKEKT